MLVVPEIGVAGGVVPLPRDAALGRVRISVLTGVTWRKYPHCRRTGHSRCISSRDQSGRFGVFAK